MGVRVGWVGGKTTQRDHFPNIGAEETLPLEPWLADDWHEGPEDEAPGQNRGDGYYFPWGLTVWQMMKWFARVRKWRFTLDAQMAVGTPTGDPFPDDYEWSNVTVDVEFIYEFKFHGNYTTDADALTATKEWQLIQRRGFETLTVRVKADGSHTIDVPGILPELAPKITDVVVNVSGATGGLVYLLNGIVVRHTVFGLMYDNLYWPRVGVTLGPFATSEWQQFSSPDFPNDYDFGDLTAEEDTFSTSIKGPDRSGLDPSEDSLRLNSASCTIEPEEYWEFANKAGNPVYATDTDTQLVDPFS